MYENATHISTGADAPRRVSQVEQVMSRADNALRHLEEELTGLTARLGSAQRPEPPTAGAIGKEQVREVLCPLAETLQSLIARIDMAARVVCDNRERLEL